VNYRTVTHPLATAYIYAYTILPLRCYPLTYWY